MPTRTPPGALLIQRRGPPLWVSYDAGGNLYFIGQPIDSAALGPSAISVTTRTGSGWTPTALTPTRSGRFTRKSA